MREDKQMTFMGSIIAVEDIKRSRQFYEEILKQSVKYDFGNNITFESRFAILTKNHFNSITKNKVSRPDQSGQNNFALYFETDAIDEFYNELRQNNIKFLHEIEEQPWGQRIFRCYDPDNYIVEIGEKVESTIIRLHKRRMAIGKIAGQTSMPLDFIKTVIEGNS